MKSKGFRYLPLEVKNSILSVANHTSSETNPSNTSSDVSETNPNNTEQKIYYVIDIEQTTERV